MKNAIVMAAGKGTRMHSDVPKVLHEVCGVPMVELIVNELKQAGAERIVTITGFGHEKVERVLEGQCEFALQEPQLGTGHAVMQARALEGETGVTVVVNGDAPCVRAETYQSLFEACSNADMVIFAVRMDPSVAYGRIIRSADGTVDRIVEFKDANEQERAVTEMNAGMYAFRNEALFEGLKELTNNNAQHEYYITDLVEIFRRKGLTVRALISEDPAELQGVNDSVELAAANRTMYDRIRRKWMKNGTSMTDPDTVYIGPYAEIGRDVVIEPGVQISGHTVIGDRVRIKAHSVLEDCTVKNGAVVEHAVLKGITIEENEEIPPFTYRKS
ncbi:MAG: NTP transferase domain-containing protein [Solobacterium sp.]|nr:NTP transferase domain-containing protein [Solobacterium sp.]